MKAQRRLSGRKAGFGGAKVEEGEGEGGGVDDEDREEEGFKGWRSRISSVIAKKRSRPRELCRRVRGSRKPSGT